jgi:hypothetical protein
VLGTAGGQDKIGAPPKYRDPPGIVTGFDMPLRRCGGFVAGRWSREYRQLLTRAKIVEQLLDGSFPFRGIARDLIGKARDQSASGIGTNPGTDRKRGVHRIDPNMQHVNTRREGARDHQRCGERRWVGGIAGSRDKNCLYRVGHIILSRYFALQWPQADGGYTVPTGISGGNYFETEDYFPFFQAEVTAVD